MKTTAEEMRQITDTAIAEREIARKEEIDKLYKEAEVMVDQTYADALEVIRCFAADGGHSAPLNSVVAVIQHSNTPGHRITACRVLTDRLVGDGFDVSRGYVSWMGDGRLP